VIIYGDTMRFKIIILLSIISISTLLAKTPDWVTNRPINNEYYIGIGFASKIKGSNDHLEKAKSEALKNLSSEITINISSEIVSNMVEKSGLLEEELKSNIRSTTQADLDGYELVEDWQNKKEYWIYYRLSKVKYQELRQAKISKALSLALDMFRQARKNEQDQQIDKALLYYLQALKPIEKYIGEALKADYNGQSTYLNNEIYISIQNLLSSINLKPAKTTMQVKRNKAVKDPLKITAYFDGEMTISNLPISFYFTKGDGDLIKSSRTNMSGVAISRISKMKSNDKMQFVAAQLDINSMINQDSTSFVYQNILKSFPLPSTKIILTVTGLSFYVESDESNLGKALDVLQVEPKLKEALSAKGYSFTDDLGSADVMVNITAKSREGSEMYGMYSTFVDLTVSAIDMSSGEEVYKNVFNNVTGQGLDFEKAGLKAFGVAAQKVVDDMLPKLMKTVE
jgi:LPP20 lipoprotein